MDNKKLKSFAKRSESKSDTRNIGVDRATAKPRKTKHSFQEALQITFDQHKKSYEELAK